MRFLFTLQGSYGDINPCAGIGVALQERGHEVVFLTFGYYQEWLQRLGLETIPTLSREEYLRIASHPDFSRPMKAFHLGSDLALQAGMREFEAIRERFEPGRTVVITRSWIAGPRLAAEKVGVPLLYLAVMPDELGFWPESGALTHPIEAAVWRKLRAFAVRRFDRRVIGPLNQVRSELGLPPVERWVSMPNYLPQSIVGLFPEWYAPPKPQWPQIQYAGFPLFDGRTNPQLTEQVVEFLAEGDPPIIITTSSIAQAAREYFQIAVTAMEKIGARAVLLSPFPDNIPPKLPPSIGYFGYVPLQQLLPQSGAIMHHGGIGTVAAALRAGIPQLIVPQTFDNAPNGARVSKMGVGSVLRRWQLRPQRVAREIENLLTSQRIKERCSYYAQKLRDVDGIESACRIIEDDSRQFTSLKSAARPAPGAC